KNKHTIEFTNNTHTPQNSHKKPQPSKKGEEATTPQSQTHNHKQSQRPATTRRNNKNNTHPTPNRQINTNLTPHTKPSNQHKPHPPPLTHHQNRTISPKTSPDQQGNNKTVIYQRFIYHKTRP
ncbi:hypothetical protein, partial [Pauljensenia sp. OF14-1SRA]|uniref:hypothetical protein n=1 Tax=Pauljensenia sp. OF14-1SRA TaxID=2998062 RepID=UPI0022E2551E